MCLGVCRAGVDADGVASTARVTGPVVLVDLDAEPDELMPELRGLRIFAGHAGWGAAQLGDEITEGAWYVLEGLPDDILAGPLTDLWFRVLRRQPMPLALEAYHPGDLSRNYRAVLPGSGLGPGLGDSPWPPRRVKRNRPLAAAVFRSESSAASVTLRIPDRRGGMGTSRRRPDRVSRRLGSRERRGRRQSSDVAVGSARAAVAGLSARGRLRGRIGPAAEGASPTGGGGATPAAVGAGFPGRKGHGPRGALPHGGGRVEQDEHPGQSQQPDHDRGRRVDRQQQHGDRRDQPDGGGACDHRRGHPVRHGEPSVTGRRRQRMHAESAVSGSRPVQPPTAAIPAATAGRTRTAAMGRVKVSGA